MMNNTSLSIIGHAIVAQSAWSCQFSTFSHLGNTANTWCDSESLLNECDLQHTGDDYIQLSALHFLLEKQVTGLIYSKPSTWHKAKLLLRFFFLTKYYLSRCLKQVRGAKALFLFWMWIVC